MVNLILGSKGSPAMQQTTHFLKTKVQNKRNEMMLAQVKSMNGSIQPTSLAADRFDGDDAVPDFLTAVRAFDHISKN